jgi:hypothetical protein
MNQIQSKFCFCTLAFGKRYRSLALLLAKDIEKYSPGTSFIVLTDKPDDFCEQSNILAFKHQATSVRFYHDKRFVVAKALSMFNSCIFIDADMRILAPVPNDMAWLQKPGITARVCNLMPKQHSEAITGNVEKKFYQEYLVTKKATSKLNLEKDWDNISYIYEYLFAVTKDCGKEIEFLKKWEIIAPYFEINGVYQGEGNAIGLAAAKAKFPIRGSEMNGISFFKAQTELIRIKKGQSKVEDMAIYFEQQRKLEYPERSFLENITTKLAKGLRIVYTLIALRIKTLRNLNFYYR